MDRPNRYLEIPPGPDPSLNKPIDLTVPQHEVSPAVREVLEYARARIEAATAQAKQQILTASAEAVKRIESSQPAPVARPKEAEPRPLEPSEPRQGPPLWKRALGGILDILDAPGRILTQASLEIADVARQVWERGHPLEKAVGVPALVAGSFVIGAMGGVASLISPKAWYETAVALAKPRETLAGLKETIAENPLRAVAITGALVAPVKLPKLAGVGIVERVKLVPEKMRVAVASEAGSLARIEAAWPAKTWKAIEAEAELARRGLAKAARAEPEQLVQLERASKASEYIMREVSKRVHTRFEQAELPTRYEVFVKDPDRLFKNYEAFIEVTGRAEVVGRRIGRMPEGMGFEVKAEDWARALAERFDWGVYERRIYAKDVEPIGFRKTKEFETFERLTVKGDRFEYAARIVDPEVVLERARVRPVKPNPPEEILKADRLLRGREVEVVRPIPAPPGVAALSHVLGLPHAEELFKMVKTSRPATLIEASKLREPPVRTDIDIIKHVAETVRLDVRPPVATTLPAHHPGPPRVLEVAHGVRPTPVVDVSRVEGLTTDTIASVGLPRFPEATILEPRVATRGEPETPRKAGKGPLEDVVLPQVELWDVVEAKPRLQPNVLKQLATGAELTGVGLPRQPITHAVKTKAAGAQTLWPGLRTPERLDLGVRALEALDLDVKQAAPPELTEPGIPALPPTARVQARARKHDKQEHRLPGLTTDLRKLRLHRWEWELPEWGRGLRKLLGL